MATPDNFRIKPMSSLLYKSEPETVAANIMAILSRTGDTWRELTFDEYEAERRKDGATDRDMMLERPYFEQAVPHTVNEEQARNFSPVWKQV